MRILAVGGGSGGHVTPVVAVLKELRAQHPDIELRFWCDHKFGAQARSIVSAFDPSLRVDTIIAGKFRRFHHLSAGSQLLSFSVVLKNIRDLFLVGIGTIQSFFKLIFWRPDVVFTKGGFVCLPVGMAARVLGIPLVIHDSDAHPGLTNRILSRWATAIATGAPLEHYSYNPNKSRYVGIPISSAFIPLDKDEQRHTKQQLGLAVDRPLIVITGGGLGATRINNAVVTSLQNLQQLGSVVLVAGAYQYDELREKVPANNDAFQLFPFVTNMPQLLGAADVVVARAGATTILELAALAKPTILIPNAKLTGGHQLKNADVYEIARAVKVVDEDAMEADTSLLPETISHVLHDTAESKAMAARFHDFSKPTAAKDMADMILSARRTV